MTQHDAAAGNAPMQFFPNPDTARTGALATDQANQARITREDAELIKTGLLRALAPVSNPAASAKELIAAFEVINAAAAVGGDFLA